jgi:hypothetical protein
MIQSNILYISCKFFSLLVSCCGMICLLIQRYFSFLFCVYTRYILFGIIVIIVLLNVLIAIVVDTYGTIRDDKTEEVFWSSRLHFVAEVEVMKNLLKNHCGICIFNPFQGLCECLQFTRFNWFIWFIRVMLGAVTCGVLWPDNVRSLLWGDQSPKDNESMKNSIQHIKKIVAFEEEESPLKSKFDSMAEEIAEIKNVVKSKNVMINEMNEKMNEMMKLIMKQSGGSNSGITITKYSSKQCFHGCKRRRVSGII